MAEVKAIHARVEQVLERICDRVRVVLEGRADRVSEARETSDEDAGSEEIGDQRVAAGKHHRRRALRVAEVGEIAQRVGFSELTNFIKFFRRAGGELPSDFRQRVVGGLTLSARSASS